jgi:putative peptide zinc metalloprotease protein
VIQQRAGARSDPGERARDDRPALSPGLELIGEMDGSGFKQAPSLVRRADGQILQFPPLLFELLRAIDGERDAQQLATVVGDRVQRGLDADDIDFLLDEKLRPQGVIKARDGSSPPIERPDPFLAFRYRVGVVSERTSSRLGAPFSPLFFPPVLLIVMAALLVADWWLFVDHGVAQALRQTIYHPGWFLVLLAGVVVCAAFHEIGHATACRYGGAAPGRMGCGLYLAWPAFYTDVSDAYRLNRRGRLRTDLGGVYFNVVIIVVCVGVYLVDRSVQVLVIVVVIEHMEIAHQLLPVIRLDGYYVVSDLTGVPDLFARIGPVIGGLLVWRKPDPRVTVLKPWVRAAVSAWVLIVVPLLVLEMVVVLIHLPRILATSWDSAGRLAGQCGHAFATGVVVNGVADAAQILVLAIPVMGLALMIVQLLRRVVTWAWRTTHHHPLRRSAAVLALGGLGAALALSWIPGRNYQPIGPGERGTEGQGLHALFSLVGGPGPLYSQQTAGNHPGSGRNPANPGHPQPAQRGPSSTAPGNPTGVPGGPIGPSLQPPVTLPPAVNTPPVTLPHDTLPPVTLPQKTLPPTTLPRVTVPRVTVPGVTLPPVTVPG